jgi:hypothetical protein
MADSSSSFVGNVTLSHSTKSVLELVDRIVEPDAGVSAADSPPIVIPSLQREFCWNQTKIEALFDSLLRGLPIGTLLLWNVDNDDSDAESEAKYQFIRHYANRSNFPIGDVNERTVCYHSQKTNPSELQSDYTFALDGQQRLTSFLIGLRGSYYTHRKNKYTRNLSSYHQEFLCLNLLNDPNREPDDASEYVFEFDFRKSSSIEYNAESDELWYPLRRVWDVEGTLYQVTDFPEGVPGNSDVQTNIKKNLTRLQQAIEAPQIPCEEISDMRNEDALELFIRRNKGGKQLSNSDIAFSLITVYWDKFEEGEDPKEVFESNAADLSKRFGTHSFSFGKGFLIRSLFYLDNERPSFEQDNLIPPKIEPLEDIWDSSFFDVLNIVFELVTDEFGITGKCIGSKTSLLPLLYYCREQIESEGLTSPSDFSETDRRKMEYWIQLTVLTNLFDIDPPTTVAHKIRPLLRGASEFPIESILEYYRDEVIPLQISRTEGDSAVPVERLVTEIDHSEATSLRNYLLTKLYDDRGVGTDYISDIDDDGEVSAIDIDHFFPASKLRNNDSYLDNQELKLDEDELEAVKEFCSENVNRFGNYTLLPQGTNQSKGQRNPEKWLTKYVDDLDTAMSIHYLPDTRPYSYDRYETFLSVRESKLIEELENRLVLYEELTPSSA